MPPSSSTISSSEPGTKPARSRIAAGMTRRPALSMVARIPLIYHRPGRPRQPEPARHTLTVGIIGRPVTVSQVRLFERHGDNVKREPQRGAVNGNRARTKDNRLAEDRQRDAEVHRIARRRVQPVLDELMRLLANDGAHWPGEEDCRRSARRDETGQAGGIDRCAGGNEHPAGIPATAGGAPERIDDGRHPTADHQRNERREDKSAGPERCAAERARRHTCLLRSAIRVPPTAKPAPMLSISSHPARENWNAIAMARATSDKPGMPTTFTGATLIVKGGNCSRMTSSFHRPLFQI